MSAGGGWIAARRLAGVVVAGLLALAFVPAAWASGSWWHVTSQAVPSTLAPGGKGQIVVTMTNLGFAEANGALEPIELKDVLPKELKVTAIEPQYMTCSPSLECVSQEVFWPYENGKLVISVEVAAGEVAGEREANKVSVSGGQAPLVSISEPVSVGAAAPAFGVAKAEFTSVNESGAIDTQAGSHPFELTGTIDLNQQEEVVGGEVARPPVGRVKDLHFDLPPGLVGNPNVIPQCTTAEFTTLVGYHGNACPPETAIGIAEVNVKIDRYEGGWFTVPLFNLVPTIGEPARFGFQTLGGRVYLDTRVQTGGNYSVEVDVNNITEIGAVEASQVTFWGVPADPRHNSQRGWACLEPFAIDFSEACTAPSNPVLSPFLTLPTSCGGPLEASVSGDSWEEPGVFSSREVALRDPFGNQVGMDGCNKLNFEPSISVAPDGQEASTPTGLTVAIHNPQSVTLNPVGLGEADVKDTTLALPEGVQISPAAADGLLACSDEQVGFTGVEPVSQTNLFTPGPVGCPDASKVGTVEIKTPLLAEPLEGAVYLAAQDANPFGSLIALYVYAEDPTAGVVVKLAGEVKLDESTGQVVTVFPNTPQVPFEEARLHFFGGSRAPLSTPPLCGSYTSTASVAPWSGNPSSSATSTFEIASGPNGAPCASPRPFQPGFEAGTTSVQAGGYSPLTMTMSRPDADQALGKLSVVFPPGVSAGLRGVRLCEEPQAATGECPAESQIGTVTVSAGLGGDPYPVETGKAYITGPYEGDPFGVDVVVPAVAGPFNLGTEVVRSKVDVDPTDAHLTVVSDPFPTMLDGIPLQLQHINVNVNRPGFVFNPTSCEPMKLTGVLGSSEGATANVATPFQVTNCAALMFKPEFAVSTSAKTSRIEGASLHVTLTLPNTPRGTGANVAKVKVSLPKQLPSPLKTLQKACTERVFAENPGNCPKASRVGEATVQTPVLEGPLSGPAYFVSHGGAKYPELIIVLTGEDGVMVQVHGETFISKQGITTATFGTVPDVPFSNFELNLPEREYPALTANGNLCKGTLLMPTEMVGQNGLKINQETKISVTGCPKSAHRKAAHRKKAKKHGKGKGTKARKG